MTSSGGAVFLFLFFVVEAALKVFFLFVFVFVVFFVVAPSLPPAEVVSVPLLVGAVKGLVLVDLLVLKVLRELVVVVVGALCVCVVGEESLEKWRQGRKKLPGKTGAVPPFRVSGFCASRRRCRRLCMSRGIRFLVACLLSPSCFFFACFPLDTETTLEPMCQRQKLRDRTKKYTTKLTSNRLAEAPPASSGATMSSAS